MLVRDVIERVESEWLRGGGANIPAWTFLTEAIGTGLVNIPLDGRAQVSRDTVLEFDDDSMELALTKTTSGNVAVPQVRGYLESTEAAHAAGTRVMLDNPFPRVTLLNGLKSLLLSLPSYGVYRRRRATGITFDMTKPIPLPADARDVIGHVSVKHGLRWQKLRKGTEFEVLHDPSPIEMQFWYGGYQGAEMRVTYKADFTTTPFTLSTDLSDAGVPESLQNELPVGLASRVLAGKEIPEVVAEHIRRQLAGQNVPPGTRLTVSQALWTRFLQALQLERVRLLEQSPVLTIPGGF